MTEISIDEYLSTLKCDGKPVRGDRIKKKLKRAIERKKQNVRCCQCGCTPIWAAGSGLVGMDICFRCLTGETDDSDDFEIKED